MTNPRPTRTVIVNSTHDDHATHETTTVNVDSLQLLAALAGDGADTYPDGEVQQYAAGVRDVLAYLAGNRPDPLLVEVLDLDPED